VLEEKLEAVRKVTELEVLCFFVICCKTYNLCETNMHSGLSASSQLSEVHCQFSENKQKPLTYVSSSLIIFKCLK